MADDPPNINARLVFELSVTNLNFHTICDYFGIPQKQRYNPNCGNWIVQWIRDMQKTLNTSKRPDELYSTGETPSSILSESFQEKKE